MTPLKIIFMGTPDFAVPALEALHAAGHEICAVYSQPPRPKDRAHRIQNSAVHNRALALGLKVLTPINFKEIQDQKTFQSFQADLAIVVAYGLILKPPILNAPRFGCINIHASLLPRWRGAAPIQRAILAGDRTTGVTLMQMDAGMDTGATIEMQSLIIEDTTTTPILQTQLSQLGAHMIERVLTDFGGQRMSLTSQPELGVTYAEKLKSTDRILNWNLTAIQLERQVRALKPWPGTAFEHQGQMIKVLQAQVVDLDTPGQAGMVLDHQLTIACGCGDALRPTILQRPGKKPLPVAEFLNSFPIPEGTHLSGHVSNHATL